MRALGSILVATTALSLIANDAAARGGRLGGGGMRGGSSMRGSGSFQRPAGGASRNYSRPSGGSFAPRPSPPKSSGSRPATRPSNTASRSSGGHIPSASSRLSAASRPSPRGSAAQLSSSARSSAGARASQMGSRVDTRSAPALSDRSSSGPRPNQRPNTQDVGNFLGISEWPSAGQRPAVADRPDRADRITRPEQRPNWSERSQGRNDQWQQRVDSRHNAWNQRSTNRQQVRNDFQQNRDQRWNKLESARGDRQNWRDQNREDWQQHRRDVWDYRGNRAEEIWDNIRDFHDDLFDDHWWGAWGWGSGWIGQYPSNPWWWWAPAAFGTAAAFANLAFTEPLYVDYGMTVTYEGDTVYVDNQPVPTTQYLEPVFDLAVSVPQPPPPLPPSSVEPSEQTGSIPQFPAEQEWLPLGVFALAQEEKGDSVMFFQLSINRDGVISGGYTGTITNDQRPIAGRVDKASQRVAWRIGENKDTIFETSLANLTLDVSPIAVHFDKAGTQTWLLVRLPEPAATSQPSILPVAPHTPPPLRAITPGMQSAPKSHAAISDG